MKQKKRTSSRIQYYFNRKCIVSNENKHDPVVGRFLNGDGIIGANGGLRGYNSFAYCSNNPVIYYDPDGESATVLICGIAVSVESIILWGVGLTVVAISIAYITDPAFRARCDKAISSIIDSFIKGLKSLHCLSTAVINYVGGQIKTIEKKSQPVSRALQK